MGEIRSILVHLDAAPGSVDRLTLAHALADRHGARVTALYGMGPDPRQTSYGYSAAAALRAAEQGEVDHQRARSRLRVLLEEREPESTWCEVAGDSLVHGFVAEAIYADLLILGGPAAPDESGVAPGGFVESVLLQSGTPSIVVAWPHRQETLGERILVAWDGSLPAARALRAALPLLRLASRVQVATWARQAPTAPYSGIDVHAWLHRHGVAARVRVREPSPRVAAELVSLAGEERADLVVMGCYGHSRLREQVFGGVTRSTLARLPMPVLMAH
jgi:nucleotide-binding universal stress UspA family protein